MKQIAAIIERASDGTYSVYCQDEIFSGMGDTIDKAKEDMMQQMTRYKKMAGEEGFKYPSFLDEDFEVVYTIDSLSIMKFYLNKGWFSLATLEKVTGISQKQLWTYVHGTRPRKVQEDRIRAGLYQVSRDLDSMFV